MNTELERNKIYLPSSSALSFSGHLVCDQETKDVVDGIPSMEEVLYRIGPLPKKVLFLGQAEDGLPILLDLSNPRPGPLLIAGDAGAGKTSLLKVMARFVVSTHRPDEIQYGVITACPQEWEDLIDFPHCVGVFYPQEQRSIDFLRALALWIERKLIHRQAVLFMIDGLDQLAFPDTVKEDMHKLLVDGPARQVWPIVSLEPYKSAKSQPWLKYFHTHLLGWTASGDFVEGVEDRPMDLETLYKGREFFCKESSHWTKFQVPVI